MSFAPSPPTPLPFAGEGRRLAFLFQGIVYPRSSIQLPSPTCGRGGGGEGKPAALQYSAIV